MTPRPPIAPRSIAKGDNIRLDVVTGKETVSAWAHVVDVLSAQRLIVDPVAWKSERMIVCGKVSHIDGIGHAVKVSSTRPA